MIRLAGRRIKLVKPRGEAQWPTLSGSPEFDSPGVASTREPGVAACHGGVTARHNEVRVKPEAATFHVRLTLAAEWARANADQIRRVASIAGAVSAVAGIAASAVIARKRLLRLEVEGLSMVPVLAPGDRLLVLRTDQIAVGDIVAFNDPDSPEHVMVKRVAGVERNSVRVEGDNTRASRDSRHMGPLPRSAIIGRVLWCYWSPYRPVGSARSRPASTTLRRNAEDGALTAHGARRRRAGRVTGTFDR